MQCPVCKDTALVMTERQGIEIDYCPNCRGVWLDRGELDKIIDRAAPAQAAQPAPAPQAAPTHQPPPQPYGYPPSHGHYPPHYKHKKKRGLLGEIFDFD